MRMTPIAAALVIFGASALSAQAPSRSSVAPPETTFVKGTVTGEAPTMGATITGSKSVYITLPSVMDTTSMSSMSRTTTTTTSTETSNVPAKPAKPRLDRKIAHGAGEAAGDASKLGKKAAHGVKEAASDVKKKVTGKP